MTANLPPDTAIASLQVENLPNKWTRYRISWDAVGILRIYTLRVYNISLTLSLYICIYIHMDLYQIRLSRTGSGRPLCRPDRHCDDLRVARHTLRYTLRYTLRKIYLLTYLEIYIVPNILSYIYKTFFYIWLIGMTYRYDLWIWPLKSVPALNQCSR